MTAPKLNPLGKREAALLTIPSRNRYKLRISLLPDGPVTPAELSLSERSRQGFRRYVIKDTATINQKLHGQLPDRHRSRE